MFLFDASNRARFDDYRNAVHDSDGLQIVNGRGERLWRPLANPRTLQVSAFLDDSPKGFGLLQRKREFADYEDCRGALRAAAVAVGRAARRSGGRGTSSSSRFRRRAR